MNYIIMSIILLVAILIIIYMLSIDNNLNKLKNKFSEITNAVKVSKMNYLNHHDNNNVLNFIKTQFKSDDNIIIPNRIYYNKTDKGYELNNINIICYKNKNAKFEETNYNINLTFIPFEKDNYYSNQTLLGKHGNYLMKINNDNQENNTEAFDMIPDIIQLTEESSEIETSDTEQLIAHNFK